MAKISFHEYYLCKYVIKLAIELHYTGLHSDIDTNWRSVTPWLLRHTNLDTLLIFIKCSFG